MCNAWLSYKENKVKHLKILKSPPANFVVLFQSFSGFLEILYEF